MRALMITIASMSLFLLACSTCEPGEVTQTNASESAVATAKATQAAPEEPQSPSFSPNPIPQQVAKDDAQVPAAKVHQVGRKIRTKPADNIKVAPVQKCPQGGCEFSCDMLTRCLFTCDGGDCHQVCGPESSCTATCTGGGCLQQCHASAGCTLRCRGGQCDQQCDAKSACSRTCKGGECKVCQGRECKVESL